MIVADTNLLVYLVIHGDYTEQAERVLGRDSGWAVPLFWKSEFRNVLTLYMRRGMLSFDEALIAMRDAESVIQGREFEVITDQVLNLALNSRCTAYDCEFIALAQSLDVPLVTSDGQILRDFPSIAVAMDGFASG